MKMKCFCFALNPSMVSIQYIVDCVQHLHGGTNTMTDLLLCLVSFELLAVCTLSVRVALYTCCLSTI